MEPNEYADLLDLAVRTAKVAGALLLDRASDLEVETKSTRTDVVTVMDTRAERLIKERIRAERPDDGFLGEESDERAGTSGVRWIVDPIDGTVNYLYDLPQYAVSIAAELDGTVVAGAVLDVAKDELFTATRGGGAQRDGVPIHCSDRAELALTLVATGFGYAAERRARQAEVLRALLPVVRDIRRLGAASLDLCAAACGRVDAYYEKGLSPWDVAAGALVASEAGARVEGLHGAPPTGEFVIAAAPGVFDELHDRLAALRADEV